MNRCDVLMVEDDKNDMDLAVRAIRSGHPHLQIRMARDGEEAVSFLSKLDAHELPRAVFLDLKLPKLDGMEVLRRIREDAQMKTLPVVILTSSDHDSDVEKCYALGANSYVVKPIESSRFGASLKEIGEYWLSLNKPPHMAH